jgi:hypothetical protein
VVENTHVEVVMRAYVTSSQTIILTIGLLLFAGATALADILIYEKPASGSARRVGSMETDGDQDVAVVCINKACNASPCSGCHTQAPAYPKYTRQEHQVHLTRHYPRMELRLGEGQEITFAGQKLRRERGRLVFVDAIGGRRPLPVGALVLKSNTGDPFAIVSTDPPE